MEVSEFFQKRMICGSVVLYMFVSAVGRLLYFNKFVQFRYNNLQTYFV